MTTDAIKNAIRNLDEQFDLLQELIEHPQGVRTESEQRLIDKCVRSNNRAYLALQGYPVEHD